VKAIILCAGMSTRMQGYTDMPKCLLPVAGKPIVRHWIDRLWEVDDTMDIIVNVHYQPGMMFEELYGSGVELMGEKELLGSAGTLYASREWIGKERFIVIYGDVWTDIDLVEFIEYRDVYKMTVAVDEREDLTGCGIAQIANGVMVGFAEKPEIPKGTHSFSGLITGEGEALNTLSPRMFDIGRDWLPHLAHMANVYVIESGVRDIGTPEQYEQLLEETG